LVTTLEVYLKNKWIGILPRKMWQSCYRRHLGIIPCNTTNGVESLNNVTKHVWDLNGGHVKLYQACKLLCEKIFPGQERKYWEAQRSITSVDKAPRADELPHRVNVPNRFYTDCIKLSKRNAKHALLYGSTEVTSLGRGTFFVSSALQKNVPHVVEVSFPRCDCRTFRKRRYLCTHLIKLLDEGHIQWADLPKSYTSHPYFNVHERGEDVWRPVDPPLADETRPERPSTPVEGLDEEDEDDFLDEDEEVRNQKKNFCKRENFEGH